MVLELIIAASVLVSFISFVGVFALSLNKNILKSILFILVAFAAGSLLGVAILDVVPEALEGGTISSIYIIVGILVFFAVERFVGWHHHHRESDIETHKHPSVYVNLIAEGVHNFVDGTLIAGAFLIDVPTGILITIAIILHEIPQEIGDFAVLVNGGLKPEKALFYNFISALTAVIGAVVAFFLSTSIESLAPILLSVAGGGFLYLSLTDLIPEIHKETDTKRAIIQFVFLAIGILAIYALFVSTPHV